MREITLENISNKIAKFIIGALLFVMNTGKLLSDLSKVFLHLASKSRNNTLGKISTYATVFIVGAILYKVGVFFYPAYGFVFVALALIAALVCGLFAYADICGY